MFNRIAIIKIIFLLIANSVNSQDTHYWTQQYGTRSTLFAGAVIGGVRDNSAIYYNPGALGFLHNKDLSVSANAYQLDRIKMNNGGGTNVDLKSSTLQTMPLIISGIFKLKKRPRHTVGYCLLTKDQFNIKTSARVDDFRNLINDSLSPGDEDYIGQMNLKSSVYEMLSGWGYGFKVSDKFSIGFGNYGSYRSFHSDWYRVSRVVPTDTSSNASIATFNRNYSIELKNVRTVFKIGAAFNLIKWKFGLTVTSPSINVWGNANILSDVTSVNVDANNNGVLENFTANDRQDKLKTNYKTPLIIGFGLEYADSNNVIAFSCEWFDKVKNYTILEPEAKAYYRPASYNPLESDLALAIKEEKKSVFNFAVAYERRVNSKYSTSVGFRTNNSYSTQNKLNPINLTYTNWNIYHFTWGITKKREKSDFSLAVNYAFGGKKDQYQWVNLSNVNSSNYFIGNPEITTVKYSSLSVVIGYTHYLK
jgi:hypothetical protein